MTGFLDRKKAAGLAVAVIVCGVAAILAKDALKAPVMGASQAAAPAARVSFPTGPLPVALRGGAARDLAARTGRGLILHFWATWCAPCREEMPALVKFVRETKGDRNIELLAVSVDEDWNVVDAWLKERGLSDLPVALDPKGGTAHRVGTDKFPETFFLTPSGEVLHHIVGAADWNDPKVRDFATEFSRSVRQ
jgi:thiol-disulfide isomerase/thioredoxin